MRSSAGAEIMLASPKGARPAGQRRLFDQTDREFPGRQQAGGGGLLRARSLVHVKGPDDRPLTAGKVDGLLITGQNLASSAGVADALLQSLG